MTIKIRCAEKSDIEEMVAMLAELFSVETDFVIDDEKQRTGLSLLLTDDDRRIIFVAVDDAGHITGMVTAQLVVSTAEGGYGALMEDMIVREKYRRRGIGTALLDAVKAWATGKGAIRIQLLADRRNRPALMFYSNKGLLESAMCGFYLKMQE